MYNFKKFPKLGQCNLIQLIFIEFQVCLAYLKGTQN